MEVRDIFIIILMFATPIISAVIDNRKKAKKRAEKAARRASDPHEAFRPFTSVDPEMPEEDEDEDDDYEYMEQPARPEVIDTVSGTEGQRTVHNNPEMPLDEPVEQEKEKIEVDPRKLIVYDAIMNPKFKE